ncbi:MAG: hypothetical protein SOZ80_03010 [Prevotella sp.]|uniref:hypothetical protein n=1 Tax=Prevotella sp. TaxID=59823 RepID=UPI002A292C62|nr:hypothetical protein [Prevotella sp.]MDD7318261.1 hypothetical protein [Prevotellaceae bacterium]MDY4019735.1 hypothetical protein [Prevotella sp.]
MKTEEENMLQESSRHGEHRHHHNHYGHHDRSHDKEHIDYSEKFKRRNISASKRRKIIEKVLFWTLCVIAVIVSVFSIYIYCLEN